MGILERFPVKKERVDKYSNDVVRVYFVDGKFIRDNIDPDFTEGGHHYVYGWIPESEIWLDDHNRDELQYILVHELHERSLMAKGVDYDTAHEQANIKEQEARHASALIDEEAIYNKIQELASRMTGVELDKAIYAILPKAAEAKNPLNRILNRKVLTTVWHGTRRVESDEELRRNGFCTYEPSQVKEWLDEAMDRVIEKASPGSRKLKYLNTWKETFVKQAYEPWRRQVSVSGIKEASCGWGFRNPELVHDLLNFAVGGTTLFNDILTEMFGEPRRIEIKTYIGIRELLIPQDIHIPVLCIKPEEIVSIEHCHIQAEELAHFPKTGRTHWIPPDKIIMRYQPAREDVERIKLGITTESKIMGPVVIPKGDYFEIYEKSYLFWQPEAVVQAYKELGQKVPVKIAWHESYLPEAVPLVLERFPYPAPEEMELGGDIGKLKITIPPPRGSDIDIHVYHVSEWSEVKGIYVGGCVKRGLGSSFRAKAHAHNEKADKYFGWICVRSIKRIGEAQGQRITNPSRLLWHEYAHILTPNHSHDDTWRKKMREMAQPITEQYRKKEHPTLPSHFLEMVMENEELLEECGIDELYPSTIEEGVVIRTSEKHDRAVEHLGYHSVSLGDDEIASLERKVPTDIEIINESQRRLRETKVVADDQLSSLQLAHLNLARAIAKEVGCIPPGGIYAAIIPPASDRVRTAGLYGTKTGALYLSIDMLSKGRDTCDTLIHELGHHRQFSDAGEAEDLIPGHAKAMKDIADKITQGLSSGEYDKLLVAIQY